MLDLARESGSRNGQFEAWLNGSISPQWTR
jgi:hypothetical protein